MGIGFPARHDRLCLKRNPVVRRGGTSRATSVAVKAAVVVRAGIAERIARCYPRIVKIMRSRSIRRLEIPECQMRKVLQS